MPLLASIEPEELVAAMPLFLAINPPVLIPIPRANRPGFLSEQFGDETEMESLGPDHGSASKVDEG